LENTDHNGVNTGSNPVVFIKSFPYRGRQGGDASRLSVSLPETQSSVQTHRRIIAREFRLDVNHSNHSSHDALNTGARLAVPSFPGRSMIGYRDPNNTAPTSYG